MNYEDLLKQGWLKQETISRGQVDRLFERAKQDLVTAKKLLDIDEAAAFSIAYSAVFHAATALINSQGYRPGRISRHKGVQEALRRTLGKEAEHLVTKFDRLRRNRNKLYYQAVYNFSTSQLNITLEDAEKILKLIENYLY